MEFHLLLLDGKDPAGSNLSLSTKTRPHLHTIKFQTLQKMKTKLIILGLMISPFLLHAQPLKKCSDVVVVPKALYDSFQDLKGKLDPASREIEKERGALEDIQKRYLGCEDRSDVILMRKQAEKALHSAETNRKTVAEAFAKVDQEVRELLRTAHGKAVEFGYLDSYSGNWGRIVTMTFTIIDDKVTTIPSFYELPDPKATDKSTALGSEKKP